MKKKLDLMIPTEPEDLKLGQFQQYLKLIEGMGDEPVLNEFVKMKIVSIFCNVPIDLIRLGFKAKDINQISTDVLTLIHKASIDNTKYTDFVPTFKIGDTTFGFMNDLEEMMAGMYADLTTYFEKWETMHKAMAVMYRPIVKEKFNKVVKLSQYKLSDYNGTSEYGELMKQMPASKAIQASFFLNNSLIKLQKCFLTSMEKQMTEDKEINTILKANSIEIGDGTKAFTQLLGKIY